MSVKGSEVRGLSPLVLHQQKWFEHNVRLLEIEAADSAVATVDGGDVELGSQRSIGYPQRLQAGSGRSRASDNMARNVKRIVTNKLRKDYLTSSPGWHLVKTKSFDPPQYNDDAIYQRKIRFAEPVTVTGFNISTVNSIAAVGLTNAFQEMAIYRIDVYGSDSDGVVVAASGSFKYGTPYEFSDYGTPGSQRSHVCMEVGMKDIYWLETNDTTPIFSIVCVSNVGIPVAGNVIIDLHCMLRNTHTALKARRHQALLAASSATPISDPPDQKEDPGADAGKPALPTDCVI